MSDALPVTFPTFIVSLASSAMVHLGETPDPMSGQTEIDLPLARNSIDLLDLLKEKTKGNLDADEARLLDSLLYDLKVRFVEAAKR